MSITTSAPRAPKRVMQRRYSFVRTQGFVNVIVNNTVHTVSEKKTLTRTRITGTMLYTGTANDVYAELVLSIWRNGKETIDTPVATPDLDNTEPTALILRDAYAGDDKDASGVAIPIRIDIDTKTQRKLDPGDLLQLSFVGSGGAGAEWNVAVICTQWFKLA